MNAEQRSKWFSLRAKSERLLDAKVPEPPSRDPLAEDALERWSRNMPTAEPEPVISNRAHVHTLPPPIDVAGEIEAALEVERAFLIEVMGESLGEVLRDMRRESADELAAEVRKLWQVLTEMQVTLSALNRMAVTGKGEVLDLPALPSRREHWRPRH